MNGTLNVNVMRTENYFKRIFLHFSNLIHQETEKKHAYILPTSLLGGN